MAQSLHQLANFGIATRLDIDGQIAVCDLRLVGDNLLNAVDDVVTNPIHDQCCDRNEQQHKADSQWDNLMVIGGGCLRRRLDDLVGDVVGSVVQRGHEAGAGVILQDGLETINIVILQSFDHGHQIGASLAI